MTTTPAPPPSKDYCPVVAHDAEFPRGRLGVRLLLVSVPLAPSLRRGNLGWLVPPALCRGDSWSGTTVSTAGPPGVCAFVVVARCGYYMCTTCEVELVSFFLCARILRHLYLASKLCEKCALCVWGKAIGESPTKGKNRRNDVTRRETKHMHSRRGLVLERGKGGDRCLRDRKSRYFAVSREFLVQNNNNSSSNNN